MSEQNKDEPIKLELLQCEICGCLYPPTLISYSMQGQQICYMCPPVIQPNDFNKESVQ